MTHCDVELQQNQQDETKVDDMVNIYGGASPIPIKPQITDQLDVYYRNKLIHLTDEQIEQIKQIIDPKISQKTRDRMITIELDEKETFLHKIFPNQIEGIILNATNNKLIQTLLILTIIVWVILGASPLYKQNMLIFALYSIFVNCTLWIPYAVCYAMSVNKKAVKYITKSFEFWLKIYYSFYWCISYVLYNYFFVSKIQKWKYVEIRMIDTALLNGILIPLIVFNISMFDGFGTNRKWKMLVSGLLGLGSIIASFYYEFFSVQDGDASIIHIYGGFGFSVLSMLINAHQILGLFLCKQAILTYYRSKTERAVSIKISPYLSWKPLLNIQQNMQIQRITSTSINTPT